MSVHVLVYMLLICHLHWPKDMLKFGNKAGIHYQMF